MAADLTIESNIGNTELFDYRGLLDFTSNIGDVDVEYTDAAFGNHAFRVNIGNLALIIPHNAVAATEFRVNIGEVSSEFPSKVATTSGVMRFGGEVNIGDIEVSSRN